MRGKKIIITGALALGVLGLTPTPASAATPTNLVSNAQFNAVKKGMTLAQVQKALGGKRLYLDYESTGPFFPSGTVISRGYSRSSESGNCWQSVSFDFDNVNDDYSALVPLTLESKYRTQFGCEGIVK